MSVKTISTILVIAIVGALALPIYHYYQTTYVGTETYAKIPAEIPPLEEQKDDSGVPVTNRGIQQLAYTYELLGLTSKEEQRPFTYAKAGDNPTPFTPGSYIKAVTSKKRVITGPTEIPQEDVPLAIRQQLE